MIYGLGERLREQRIALKISQKDVANAIGVSPAIVSNYENSERTPSVETLLALANLYGCSIDYLLGKEKYSASIDISMLNDRQQKFLQQFLFEIRQ